MTPEPDMMERSRAVLLAQWEEIVCLRGDVLKSSDREAIHDLRVASRRFRAALGLFGAWIPAKKAELLKKQTRKLTRLLGGLRNVDEAILFFRLHTPAATGGGYQICRILAELRPEELARIKKTLAALDVRRYGRTVRKAMDGLQEEQLEVCGSISLPAFFSDTSLRLFQPIQGLLPAATSRENRESRHSLRIAIKKWRYFFEIVAPVLGCDISSIVSKLKEYQTLLGRMNDVAEFGRLCGDLKLSRHERRFVETILQDEDELLLQKLTALITQKPLTYTYPV